MIIDRYTRLVLSVIAAALAGIALHLWRPATGWMAAVATAEAESGPEYTITMPRAWGKLIGYGNGNLLLEAADGTLREVDIRGEAPKYPRVKTVIQWK